MISFTTTDRHESKIKQRKNQMNNISEFRKSQNELYLKYSLEDTKIVVLSNRNAKKDNEIFPPSNIVSELSGVTGGA